MTAFVPTVPRFPRSSSYNVRTPRRPRPILSRPNVRAAANDASQSSPDNPQPDEPAILENTPSPTRDPNFISIVEESKGPFWAFSGQRVYMVDMDASECDVIENRAASITFPRSPVDVFRIFLPEGWPQTVAPGYTDWVKWHICRQIFRNAYYVLGTTSLLYSLGLGTGQALAVGSTLKWVLKDGLGMGTKLLVSTNLANLVDADSKRWRFAGDTLMALSASVEILSVVKPAYFLLFGTVAALLKEAGGAMSGPAYRVFLDSFAVSSNIGDVSSRGEGQVVIGNLLGLGLGVAIKTFLDSQASTDRLLPTLVFFGVLAASHLGSTFNAISAVRLKTLNWQRLNLIIDEYISSGQVPSVETVNKSETFLYVFSPLRKRLRIGVPLLDFVECGRDVTAALRNRKDRFAVAYNNNSVGIMLRQDAGPEDIVFAMLQGRRLLDVVDDNNGFEGWSRFRIGEMTAETYVWARRALPSFLEGLTSQGWSTAKTLMGSEDSYYRLSHPS